METPETSPVPAEPHRYTWKRAKCLCDDCVRISPMRERIDAALPPELKADFEYLMHLLFIAEDDNNYLNAKFNGTWPGWEWIIEAQKTHEGRIYEKF